MKKINYEIGEVSNLDFGKYAITSTFVRLANDEDVYEFYTVNNGNMYIKHYELSGWIDKPIMLGKGMKAKEKGNEMYIRLRKEGYINMGTFEGDVCGYSKRIK